MFHLHNFKLQTKLILIYITMSVIPIVCISIITFTVYYKSMAQESNALIEQSAKQHDLLIEERMQTQKKMLFELVTDQNLILQTDQINQAKNAKLAEAAWSKKSILGILRSNIRAMPYTKGMILVTDSNDYIYYFAKNTGGLEKIWADTDYRSNMYAELSQASKPMIFPNGAQPKVPFASKLQILLAYPVRDLVTRETKGALFLVLDESILTAYEGSEANGIYTVIVDQNNQVLSYQNNDYILKPLDELIGAEFEQIKQLRENRTPISNTSWTIVNLVDESTFLNKTEKLSIGVLALTAAFILIFCLLMYFVFKRYIRTIEKIAYGIDTYEIGKKPIEIPIETKDDLYIIAQHFYTMTERINTLLQDIEKNNIAIQKATLLQKKAEIQALEAQINPHFLYNTLDSMNWMALEQDQIELSNAIGHLAELLRYSISNIDTVVTFSDEINWIENYVYLQKERFSDAFKLKLLIDSNTLDFPIYKLLFQPIIENSILHGFESMSSGGLLTVMAKLQNPDSLIVKISDNGQGMEPEMVEEIRSWINHTDESFSDRIGILNTINRIHLYYPNQAKILIESKRGIGTTYTFIIPRIDWQEMQ